MKFKPKYVWSLVVLVCLLMWVAYIAHSCEEKAKCQGVKLSYKGFDACIPKKDKK